MPHALLVNDVDLNSLGLKVERVDGLGDGITQRLITDRVPGRAGVLPLATTAGEVPPRQVTAVMTIRPRTSLLALEVAMVQLYALCGGGKVALRDGRDPSKVAFGLLEAPQEVPFDPQYLASDPASRITLRFTCDDPYRYDVAARLVAGITTVAREIPLGNVPVAPVFEITGATNPTITLRNAAGIALATMGFTVNQGANDLLRVDGDAQVIEAIAAGAPSDGYALWTTKGDAFLKLDPHDGDPVNGVFPTLEISSGLLNVLYRRAFA